MPAPSDSFPVIDGLALLVILGLGTWGALKGAVRFVIGLLTLASGSVLSGRFGGQMGAETWPGVAGSSDPARNGELVGMAAVFVLCLVAGALVARVLRASLAQLAIGGLDRLVGFLLGATQGSLIMLVLVFVLAFLDVPDVNSSLQGSHSLQAARELARSTRGWFPPGARSVIDDTFDLHVEPGDPFMQPHPDDYVLYQGAK